MASGHDSNCPYYSKQELENTPSIRDGLTYEAERQYRKEGARFIIDICREMNLGYETMATGVVYFHRFYMVKSFKSFPRYFTACCALFLAGKIEETPKVSKDLIRMAKKNLLPCVFADEFGEEPDKKMFVMERILLQSMHFDIMIDHPYKFILKYRKSLERFGKKESYHKIEAILEHAWMLVNDSLWCTTLCLEWEPEVIAIVMLNLAIKFQKYEFDIRRIAKTSWWEKHVEGLPVVVIEDICHEVLDLCFHQKFLPTGRYVKHNSSKIQRPSSTNTSSPSIENTHLQKAQSARNNVDETPGTPLPTPSYSPVTPMPPPPSFPPALPSGLVLELKSSPPLPPPPSPPSFLTNSSSSLSFSPVSTSSPPALSPPMSGYLSFFPASMNSGLQITARSFPSMDYGNCVHSETLNYLLPPPPPPPPILLPPPPFFLNQACDSFAPFTSYVPPPINFPGHNTRTSVLM